MDACQSSRPCPAIIQPGTERRRMKPRPFTRPSFSSAASFQIVCMSAHTSRIMCNRA